MASPSEVAGPRSVDRRRARVLRNFQPRCRLLVPNPPLALLSIGDFPGLLGNSGTDSKTNGQRWGRQLQVLELQVFELQMMGAPPVFAFDTALINVIKSTHSGRPPVA